LRLPAVEVENYNVELSDDEGFIGDRARRISALHRGVAQAFAREREIGQDPFGEERSEALAKKHLDALLVSGDREAAGIVQDAIESFAQELALVVRRFLKLKGWKQIERLVFGGGFSGSRVGELAIGRASVILKAGKIKVDIAIVRQDPGEAGLLGSAHLAHSWIFKAHDALLAVDIGGTNIRAGIIALNQQRAADLSKAKVSKFELWRHGDEKLEREDAVDGLIQMLKRLIKQADEDDLHLAPFIGIGCPGKIEPDGSIDRGAQNLPGNWESSRFNLCACVVKAIPEIGDSETSILMRRGRAGPQPGAVHAGRGEMGCLHHRPIRSRGSAPSPSWPMASKAPRPRRGPRLHDSPFGVT
jgi:hypothetical protein